MQKMQKKQKMQKMKKIYVLESVGCYLFGLIIPFVVGCATSGGVKKTNSSQPVPVERMSCYFGETVVSKVDGTQLGSIQTMVRRRVQPKRNRIIEEVINIDPRPEVPNQFYHVVLDVKGDEFTMKEQGGSFEGKGRLFGASWNWDTWESESKLSSGGRVVSRDRLSDQVLTAEKQYFDQNGALQMMFKETLKLIDEETCAKYWSKAKEGTKKAGESTNEGGEGMNEGTEGANEGTEGTNKSGEETNKVEENAM